MTLLADLGARLLGAWTAEAKHHLMPDPVSGEVQFEWFEGEKFLIYLSAFDHPDIPDGWSMLGDTDGLQLHYFDTRGVHRLYAVTVTDDGWSYEMGLQPDGGFGQRLDFTFDGPDAMTAKGYLTHDGTTWEDDIVLTYRRTS